MKWISWFAGIGGFDLGLTWAGVGEPVAYSEIDPYCCRVYEQHFPGVPNLGDIKQIEASDIPEADLWCGGFPCQPFSVAGARKGTADERDLWPVWAALIRAVRPRIVLAENVPGLLTGDGGRWFGRCVRDLAEAGYVVEWTVVGAYEVGAPHRRDRLWIVATIPDACADRTRHTAYKTGRDGARRHGEAVGAYRHPGWAIDPADVADCDITRPQGHGRHQQRAGQCVVGAGGEVADAEGCAERPGLCEGEPTEERRGRHGYSGCPHCGADQGPTTPLLGRVASGIPNRVDRLRALGNSVVPQVVEWIGKRIIARHGGEEVL